jgi:hypothetical protein
MLIVCALFQHAPKICVSVSGQALVAPSLRRRECSAKERRGRALWVREEFGPVGLQTPGPQQPGATRVPHKPSDHVSDGGPCHGLSDRLYIVEVVFLLEWPRLVFLTKRGWQVRAIILNAVREVEVEWASLLGQQRFGEFMNTLRQLSSVHEAGRPISPQRRRLQTARTDKDQ